MERHLPSAVRPPPFAQVVVNTPLGAITSPRDQNHALAESLRERAFTYSIPAHLADSIAIGQLVWVSFGARRVQGVVVAFSDTSPVEQTKPIDEISERVPFLSPERIEIARWIAREYLCAFHDAIQLFLPPGVEQEQELWVGLAPGAALLDLAGRQKTLGELLTREGETRLRDLPRELQGSVEALARRGILVKRTVLKPARARPKQVKSVRLSADDAAIARALAQLPSRLSGLDLIALTPKYAETQPSLPEKHARALVQLREHGTPMSASEFEASVLRGLKKQGYVERSPRGESRSRAIVDYLRGENRVAWVSAVYAATDATLNDLRRLEAAGVVELTEEEVWRDPLAGRAFEPAEPPRLTDEQESAWNEIVEDLRLKVEGSEPPTFNPPSSTFLLHGVTGSGKTEIYLRAIAETLAHGKQAIALVPEISLTPQTLRRFGARFPKRLAVFHSKLSLGERFDTWRRCRDGQVDIVIGSRSALFMPLPRVGVIVLDEEHDASYKQQDAPHYHTRAVALEMARRLGAVVILGSATPDLESYHRAQRGEYKLLELPRRIMGHARAIEKEISDFGLRISESVVRQIDAQYEDARYLELPPVHIVDLRAELKAGNRAMFSRALQKEMARVLVAREQAILFLNRRGTATFILCRDCGHVFKCRRCDNPMTFHGGGDALLCHHCGRRDRVPTTCPHCASARIRFFGLGTEKVEEEIKRLYPQARTLRWDLDVTHGKESHEEILQKFILHQADILIGTQMIAKGLDLPRVTLVGVVSADTSLNLPDFRAAERTFQLLAQVAGRAGRSALGGQVILQTYNPDHYAIQAAAAHDYRSFYAREIAFRQEQGYPPFNRLIRLVYHHPNEKRAQAEAERLHHALATRIAQKGLPATDLVGPAPAFFRKLRGEYRWQILVRGEHPHALVEEIAWPLGWRVDVDAVSVL